MRTDIEIAQSTPLRPIGEIARIAGGNGGGRPDSAMAGGKDPAKMNDALAAAKDILAAQLNQ